VEELPKVGRPLDPGPGLGGNLSLGLFLAKSSSIFEQSFPRVTAVTGILKFRPDALT
jgi:hypothetical protein